VTSDDAASPFRRPARPPLAQRTFPVTQPLPHYPKHALRGDLLAGVARLKGHVREQFDATRLTDGIGEDRSFPTVARAVQWCSAPRE
jgi:hypothetical protein